MKKFQQSLDTRSLQLFITVMESSSLTEAADKLGINQSTISHALDKLRTIFNDPLLVRSGRSVTSTARAIELLPKAKQLLSDFNELTETPHFEPHTADIRYTIAANDFQCEMLLPALYRHIKPLVKSLQISIIPSWIPDSGLLRNEEIDMVLSPTMPDGSDIMRRKLYEFQSVCYYDAKQRQAPKSEADFINADYICPNFLLNHRPINLSSQPNESIWLRDKTQIITNSFNSTADFLLGTEALTIAPNLLAKQAFKGFAQAPFPYGKPSAMHLVWNKKYQKNPKHAWFRQQLALVAEALNKD